MPLGLRGGYQFETGPYVGGAGEWSLSVPNQRESGAGYYQLAAEFGYDYSPLPRYSVVPFARVGYARTFQTFCGRPSSSGCDLERDDGLIGQLGVRTLFRSGHFFGGFEFDYQFGALENVGFRFSNGIRF